MKPYWINFSLFKTKKFVLEKQNFYQNKNHAQNNQSLILMYWI